ncbi:MAG: cytochrome c1 [Alphaproteobacteria bacterium]|nr:cytochrome c1 [Alphaproteobacteria bacterium]
MRPRRVLPALLAGAVIAAAVLAQPARPATAQAAGEEAPPLPDVSWSFEGPFGTFDRAALQRGFQIYTEICSACHSMNLVTYDDLAGPSGLGYTEAEVKAIAAQKQIADIDKNGQPIQRPARPSDHFVAPFPNESAARTANNGAVPPDLSDMIKARDGGARYVYGILTGFRDAPKGVEMRSGMNYNLYFPGHQIAMPQPLQDNSVQYADGTKATLDQEAHDVVTFLTWAADPTTEERKRTGAKVILFLLAMTGVLYGAKRRVWSDIEH